MSPEEEKEVDPLKSFDLGAWEKEPVREKRVLREVIQKVEELLGVLGKVGGHAGRHGTQGPTVAEPRQLDAFLEMNAEEGFDLEALNALDMRALEKEARGEKRLLREAMQKVEELTPRLRSETEDPAFMGAILRHKTLDWYRRSPSDANWAETMVPRWAGTFSESRVPGGRLSPKLSARLESLHLECQKASSWAVALHRINARAGSLAVRLPLVGSLLRRSTRPLEPLTPQVAQACLDDLAASGRNGDRPLPLQRLTRLARRIGAPEMNMTLGALFPQEGGEPFVVLDPRLYPDTDGMTIRPPPPRVVGDAVAYDLVPTRASLPLGSGAPEGATMDASLSSPWDRRDMKKEDWTVIFRGLQERRARLEPPPIENYRNQESYRGLRELLLEDPSARSAFLAIHWKGKPAGLAMLARLLSEATFSPEVETDADYLEAELNHIETGDPDRRPPDGRWNLGHRWTVVRGLTPAFLRSYRADQTPVDRVEAAAIVPSN